jgi:hypothetical protein
MCAGLDRPAQLHDHLQVTDKAATNRRGFIHGNSTENSVFQAYFFCCITVQPEVGSLCLHVVPTSN